MRRWRILLVAVIASACRHQQTWEGGQFASPELIERELSPALVDGADRTIAVPYIPVPQHLRPCCAFGSGLGISLGTMPLPGIEITNTIGLADLGLHTYDNGTLAFDSSRRGAAPFNFEKNGLIYTCRGGFIDTAHVRDWADWTLFLSTTLLRMAETGGIPFRKRATVEIDVQPELAARMGLKSTHITQDDFGPLIRRIGDEARGEFGPDFDRP